MAQPTPHSGKVALVTGAARGNGLAIAQALARGGATVYLADLDSPLPEIPYPLSHRSTLEDAVETLRAAHPRVYPLICDVRHEDQVRQAIGEIERAQGHLDILVNNAGVLALNPIAEVSEAQWDVQMDVIAKGAFHCCRLALPGMNARGWGRVINIASVAGHRAIGLGVAYTAAKHALIGLTRALAMEVAQQNVTVNAVCPGTVPTPLIEGTAQALHLTAQQALERFSARHLTGRPVSPEDVAAAVVWLASEEAARVTGSSLFVDDGWHVQ
ncbi:MAG: SDR family oxidoreductase [SAR324 cluster bacterium]|nr:SDR family oxidoreductase [SAR324 cluster bacterium]MCZ6841822.1 SDR family oxidoreductase [SAR324 cluster bacterium]